MITFNKITYQNYKSVGNSPVTIELNSSGTTLLTGKNGSGKSTLTSAICFSLFGQDFVLNKPGLVNSINQKHLLVTIEFSIGKKNYRVVRGIKPNIFKIYENEKLLNEDSSSRDYQKILETQILKMDIRAFTQVVIVGGRSYVPFMKLKSNDRREFIEDLLDIRIFSTMNVLTKEKVKLLKDEMKGIDDDLKTIKEHVKLQESFIKKLTVEKSVSVSKIQGGVDRLERDNETIAENLKALTTKEQELLDAIDILKDSTSKLVLLKQEHKSFEDMISGYKKSIDFYRTTDVCPTCTQKIEDHHRDIMIETTSTEIDCVGADIIKLVSQIETAQINVDFLHKQQKELSELQKNISGLQSSMYANIQMIKKAHIQIEEMSLDTTSIDVEKSKLKDIAKKFVTLDTKKKKCLDTQQYYEFVQQILSDGGIKTKIIRQYIPTINKLINKYLASLDFFVSFHLDENFDESIKSRHRDTFKYDNFSDGQAARIDLSLMFAWRDIAKMRNAVNVNLAIFDESDASMDLDGSSLLTDLFSSLEKTNVFVISHKEAMKNKVDKVITLDVKNNFTVLVDSLD